jgi:hypothetical protein
MLPATPTSGPVALVVHSTPGNRSSSEEPGPDEHDSTINEGISQYSMVEHHDESILPPQGEQEITLTTLNNSIILLADSLKALRRDMVSSQILHDKKIENLETRVVTKQVELNTGIDQKLTDITGMVSNAKSIADKNQNNILLNSEP